MNPEIEFHSDPIGFALKYSLKPKDEAYGYSVQNADMHTIKNEGNYSGWRSSMVRPVDQKAFVKFSDNPIFRGCLDVKPRLYSYPGEGGLPAYFLPWDQRGGTVRMTIPNKNTKLTEKRHPKLFFTAALSGCSVFFNGNVDNPTIYHAGSDGMQRKPVGNNFYEELILRCRIGGHDPSRGNLRIMQKDAYLGQTSRFNQPGANVVNLLGKKHGNAYVQESYERWGCVFGFRINEKWEFYLQRNVTVKLRTWDDLMRDVVKTRYWGLLKTVVKEPYKGWSKNIKAESYPESVQKIFPGVGKVKILPDTILVKL